MPAVASKPEAVKVPRELHSVRASALEEYVRARIHQFSSALTPRVQDLAPSLTAESLDRAVSDTLKSLPTPDYGNIPLENMELQLVFRHDCLALGCLDPQCALCQHNSNRRCSVNFDKKYLVNDVLKAKCGAIIRVELVDKGTGMVVEENIPDLRIEMVMLDGNMYDTKFLESGRTLDNSPDAEKELDGCMLLMNNKQQPLLMCGPGGVNEPSGKVVLQLQKGKAVMPEIHVTDSSEALLSGRKPPYRLLVQAVVKGNGPKLNIRYAVSEGFVVATRRTRTAGKADIPSMDDHVSKLEHMGKETVKKLQDIHGAAMQCGIDINIPENSVQKVGDFKALAMRAEQDGHLKQKLQHVLKLCKEKWDEARDHAMKAVVADNRMRAWYADRGNMDVGLLFLTRLGNVDLERPIGLLQRKTENGEPKIECTLMAQQTPAQRETVRSLNPQAAHNWWLPGHPGWAIFPMDSEMFLQTGQLLGPAAIQPSSPTSSNPVCPPSPPLTPLMHQDPHSPSQPAPVISQGPAPPRRCTQSLPPDHLSKLLGDYNESMVARMSLPPPKAPLSDPGRGSLVRAGVSGTNHLTDYSALTAYTQGNGIYGGPASPGLSPKGETPSLSRPALSPRQYMGVNGYPEPLVPLSAAMVDRPKRKKETSSTDTETLSSYQPRVYQANLGSRSPTQLTPPGSPLHSSSLPTPFRPVDNVDGFRPPIFQPVPAAALVQYPGAEYPTAIPHGNYLTSLKPANGYAPPEFTEAHYLPNSEVSLTNGGLATFAPSFDLDKSLELPDNWKQFDVIGADGSLQLPPGWHVHRANSGLETMQSIEEALPTEYR